MAEARWCTAKFVRNWTSWIFLSPYWTGRASHQIDERSLPKRSVARLDRRQQSHAPPRDRLNADFAHLNEHGIATCCPQRLFCRTSNVYHTTQNAKRTTESPIDNQQRFASVRRHAGKKSADARHQALAHHHCEIHARRVTDNNDWAWRVVVYPAAVFLVSSVILDSSEGRGRCCCCRCYRCCQCCRYCCLLEVMSRLASKYCWRLTAFEKWQH